MFSELNRNLLQTLRHEFIKIFRSKKLKNIKKKKTSKQKKSLQSNVNGWLAEMRRKRSLFSMENNFPLYVNNTVEHTLFRGLMCRLEISKLKLNHSLTRKVNESQTAMAGVE